jgi:hypothetical protein
MQGRWMGPEEGSVRKKRAGGKEKAVSKVSAISASLVCK